ncbi:hypothetical protein SAMN05216532_8607 [Streptomyces sp. 2231.1]|nr:hypothetical protein SAMN05216532_8463 [Streptomyces sp. 2231.1]SEE73013.1 hypothetical protein SAMN05216532_8607 [Streptomyces sp. 2231.1]
MRHIGSAPHGPVLADTYRCLAWWLLPASLDDELDGLAGITVHPPGWPLHCPPVVHSLAGRWWLALPDGSGQLTDPTLLAAAFGPGGYRPDTRGTRMTTGTRALVDIPADVLPLLPLPDLNALPDARARGAECVWSGEPLSTATAIDLGERPSPHGTTLFLRGCQPCTRRAVRAAHHAHPGTCEQCTDDPTLCETRRALRALALELRR